MATILGNNAYYHRLTARTEDHDPDPCEPSQFMLDSYNLDNFQGILPDTGAAGQSTAGKAQILAL